MGFTDSQIRAIVKTGQYSNPAAERYIADCLIARRDKIGRTYFARVLPLDRFEVRGGLLTFEDLAQRYGFGKPREYAVKWSTFDNETGAMAPAGRAASGFNVPESDAEFLAATISDASTPQTTVTVYLRRIAGGRDVVGVERNW
jgi:hypothetical protein